MAALNDPKEIAETLRTARTIAVVGCSPDPMRSSNAIARYLISSGYEVIPVNPRHEEILGRACYPDLAAIPASVKIDVVDVFRRSEFVTQLAEDALSRGVGFFWMQDGVEDDPAARRLMAKGVGVVMNRCIYRDRETLRRGGKLS